MNWGAPGAISGKMGQAVKRAKNGAIMAVVGLSRRIGLPKRNLRASPKPSRFLIITTTGVGDTLWGTPAIKALKEADPGCNLGVLTNPAGGELLKGNPYIDELFIFRRGFAGLFSLPALLKGLRRKNYDTALIFHASDRIVWPICFFAGPSEIIGIRGENKGLDFILTRAVDPPGNAHGIEKRFMLLGDMAPAEASRGISIYLDDKDRHAADGFLKLHGFDKNTLLVGLHPGAQKPYKCWPVKNFIEAGNIISRRTGCRIIITGDSNERPWIEEMASRIKGAVSAAGKTSLRQTAALIERMDLFITNDTGVMHIAAALKTPTVALFCPTDPRICGPYGAESVSVVAKPITCDPCTGKKCLDPLCMGQITVEEVVKAAKRLLGAGWSFQKNPNANGEGIC